MGTGIQSRRTLCVARAAGLAEKGHELRRPEAALWRAGIHELRERRGRVHYRVRYFMHGRTVAVMVCGLSKEGRVPDREIDRARERRAAFEKDPARHTFETELDDDG